MRLFVQVRPPQPALDHLGAALRGLRTSNPEQWHVTLAFLGEVDDPGVLTAGLRAAAQLHEPFSLRLAGSGSFGPRATWVAVGGDVDALRSLAVHVQDACRDAGVALERRAYRPHLTVGRVDPTRLTAYEGPAFRVDELQLVRSVLGQRAVHHVLERHPLGPQAHQA